MILEGQKKEEKVKINLFYILNICFIEIIFDHEYDKFMKFPDVLYDGALPTNNIPKEYFEDNERKKQQIGRFFGFGM